MPVVINRGIKLDYSDVLLVPKPSSIESRKQVDLMVCYQFADRKRKFVGVPIICANMKSVSTPAMGKVLADHCLSQALPKDAEEAIKAVQISDSCWYTSGITKDFSKFDEIASEAKDAYVCLDVANGYLDIFMEFVAAVRRAYSEFTIMAGNVATPLGAERLLNAGADIIKIGIGPGSVCTTRLKTGVGIPQFSAVLECAAVTRSYGAYSCADGGFRNSGDITKAFGAGADFVMSGYLFAGTDEAGQDYKGESSKGGKDYRTKEGKAVTLEKKGPVNDVVLDLLGGLRSGLSYCGYRRLEDFIGNGEFVQVNRTHNRILE